MLHYVRILVHILFIHFLMTYSEYALAAVLLPSQLPSQVPEDMALSISTYAEIKWAKSSTHKWQVRWLLRWQQHYCQRTFTVIFVIRK